jgi:hypothetical protein
MISPSPGPTFINAVDAPVSEDTRSSSVRLSPRVITTRLIIITEK